MMWAYDGCATSSTATSFIPGDARHLTIESARL
jgi:hypothetical protein